MWNEHQISSRFYTTEGHGGGIPSVLFQDPIGSETVQNEATYQEAMGELEADGQGRLAVDGTTQYGVASAPARFDEEEMDVVELRTEDPLGLSPILLQVRSAYLHDYPMEVDKTDITAMSGAWVRMQPYVQEYIRYKKVSHELLVCACDHQNEDGSFDWVSFAQSQSSDAYAASIGLRAVLAAIAARL